MSSESIASTSSIPMPESWEDLSKLGEYILAQLGDDRRSENLLVHWIAHRLAEHMQRAETASDTQEREAARDAAALLIARLWEARGGWPQGWPTDTVQELVEGLDRRAARTDSDETLPLRPWLSTLGELETLQLEERAAWVNAGLLELGADELRRALDVAPEGGAEPADISDIRRQLRYYEKAEEWVAARAAKGEDLTRRADRTHIFERVLDEIGQRRHELVERALRDSRRGQRRKPKRASEAVGTARRRAARKASRSKA